MQRNWDSETFFQRSQALVPGGVHSPVRALKGVGGAPPFFATAQGPYMTSVEGRRYIDFCQSFGPMILGHRDADVEREVEGMLHKAWSFGACEPYSLQLAEWICQEIPWVEKVRFVNSGTEAVMTALRLARGATGRAKILKFDGCYHGHTDAMLVKAGSGLAGVTASDSQGVPPGVIEDTLIAPLDDELRLEEIFRLHGATIAALIVEPLPANFGLLPQRQEFLQRAFTLAHQHGALVIFDEVISGFRTSLQGMAGVLGLSPDICVYGKVMGGGFPVGAVGGRTEIMDHLAPLGGVYQAGTLSANPMGMVAGLHTLSKLKKSAIIPQLNQRVEHWCQGLNQSMSAMGWPVELIQAYSLFWLKPKSDQPMRATQHLLSRWGQEYPAIFHALLRQGVYFPPSPYEVGFVGWAHTPEILAETQTKLLSALEEVYG